jgi:CDP-2,3-bis-(O-geranylgeranyl)-sn-glycerol synthase
MSRILLLDFLLLLPAFIANAAPVLAKNIPYLRADPVHPAVFGKNKTWRGFLAAVAGGMLTAAVLHAAGLGASIPLYSTLLSALCVGALLGFGAIAGDMIESAIKRRIGIPPGGALPFWDGADHIIGALLVLSPLYVPNIWNIVLLLVIAPVLSLAANLGAYWLGWKERWY